MFNKDCSICGTSVSIFKRNELKDGRVCNSCTQKIFGVKALSFGFTKTVAEIKKAKDIGFQSTLKVYKGIDIDENQRKIRFDGGIFDFEDIISVDVYTDERAVYKKKGVGRALVGGVMFGGAGAIVGAVTGKSKQKASEINEIKLKVTIKDLKDPIRYVYIHKDFKLKVGTGLYNSTMEDVDRIIAIFESLN